MFYYVECPQCNFYVRVQLWKDGQCSCGAGYEWGDDGDEDPEIYFPCEDVSANDNIEMEAAA